MNKGTLYIIASPIGNLEDITFRAIRILKELVDRVYCEDTRQTKKLLNHYNINLPAYSLHEHSNQKKIDSVIDLLIEGKSIAYLTDSGTPGISDPGGLLTATARNNEIPVVPLPGPSALAAILSVSGFPGRHVHFAGFLSKKEGKRKKELEKLKELPGIIIVYESPYRIKKLIKVINELFPEKEVLIGREMTKMYEEFIHGTGKEIYEALEKITEKGEFTVVINNN